MMNYQEFNLDPIELRRILQGDSSKELGLVNALRTVERELISKGHRVIECRESYSGLPAVILVGRESKAFHYEGVGFPHLARSHGLPYRNGTVYQEVELPHEDKESLASRS